MASMYTKKYPNNNVNLLSEPNSYTLNMSSSKKTNKKDIQEIFGFILRENLNQKYYTLYCTLLTQ